ncbi:MAG: ligase-associated DNA damage response endonuclease PdeM [Leptolyngbyaceae bacterium]|nr:ligase-associated DNA damage response endonuclease PdeM [Leptolyngbyaceae bacterium]
MPAPPLTFHLGLLYQVGLFIGKGIKIVNSQQSTLHSGGSHCLRFNDSQVWLLPEKAIFIEDIKGLLVSDVHLGKAETFQRFGIPISSSVNQTSLSRLLKLCHHLKPEHLFILGDLFHSPLALVEEVIEPWVAFVNAVQLEIHLIVGNHDRGMVDDLENLFMHCHTSAIALGDFRLSHEPDPFSQQHSSPKNRSQKKRPKPQPLNICGHVHPCVRLKTRLDDLRLPCFYLEEQVSRLTLPSFGAFTGGFEVDLSPATCAYAIADETIIPFES